MADTVLLRHLLGAGGDLGSTAPLVGVEHELQAHTGSTLRDFRSLLPTVAGPVLLCDPGDPRARRLRSGVALTADGWEAELVTPPLPLDAAAPAALARMLAEESARLLTALQRDEPTTRLTGFSTHINVSVPDSAVIDVAREFAARFAAATMLLLDRPGSPGLLVRPRRGRLEIGGEYAEGEDLAAAVTFVSAAVSHLLSQPAHTNVSVGEGNWTVEPARERFGHFVPADAVAPDLYASGRRCLLRHAGAWVTGQHHLQSVWSVLRSEAISIGLDPAPVDRRVAGLVPLPCEHGEPAEIAPGPGDGAGLEVLDPAARVRERETLVLEPVWLTWNTTAWRCEDSRSGRTVHLVMPVSDERVFLERLDSGRLDTFLRVCLRRRIRPAPLVNSTQSRKPGVWTTVRPDALVPAERGADGIPMSGGSGGGQDAQAKERRDESAPSPSTTSRPGPPGRRSWWVAGAAAGLLAAGGVAAALTLGGSGSDEPAASPTAPGAATAQGAAAAPATETGGSGTEASETEASEGGGSVDFAGVFTSACDPAAPDCDTYVEPDVVATLACDGDACVISFAQVDWAAVPPLTRSDPTTFTGEDVNICDQPVTVTVELVGSALSMEQVGGSSPPSCWSGTNTFEGEYVAGELSGWAP